MVTHRCVNCGPSCFTELQCDLTGTGVSNFRLPELILALNFISKVVWFLLLQEVVVVVAPQPAPLPQLVAQLPQQAAQLPQLVAQLQLVAQPHSQLAQLLSQVIFDI